MGRRMEPSRVKDTIPREKIPERAEEYLYL